MFAKKISYVIIDTLNHVLSNLALEKSLCEFPLENILIFSDEEKFWGGREIIKIPEIKNTQDYNDIVFNYLPSFLKTNHALFIQYDGYVLSGKNFYSQFLNFDYIGAPWPQFKDFSVGNGGFSLRSSRLINEVRSYLLPNDYRKPEDLVICRYLRARLEDDLNLKFAPVEVANYFSFEQKGVNHPTFGFHGAFHLPMLMAEDLDTLFFNIDPKCVRKVLTSFSNAFKLMPKDKEEKFLQYFEKNFPDLVYPSN